MALRPTKYPKWASVDEIDPITGNANKVEPPLQWQNSGVKRRQPVPRQYLNYHNDLTSDWIEYLDEQVSAPTPIPNILGAVYPVGSIHLSINAANPSTYGFPGTWTAISQGRALFGVNIGDSDFNTARRIGGSKSHAHGGYTGSTTLTVDQIPPHTHTITDLGGNGEDEKRAVPSASDNTETTFDYTTTSTGGGLSHNHTISSDRHLNPYYCVYMWERVS